MGMESSNVDNGPTKESFESRLVELAHQKEVYTNRLTQAQDTPVSNIFSEGEKDMAIKNHQQMLDLGNAETDEIKEKLAGLNS